MRRVPTAVVVTAILVGVVVGGTSARSSTPPAYQVGDVGAYGGEPSIVSDKSGHLYVATPEGGTLTYLSTDRGQHWQQGPLGKGTVPDLPSSGAAHRLSLTRRVGRHVEVVEIALFRLGRDGVEPLHVARRPQRGAET